MLWNGCPPSSAASNLRTYAHRLRALLGPRLVSDRICYTLYPEADELDVARFQNLADEGRQALRDGALDLAVERLGRALSLWRGRPFPDLTTVPHLYGEIARLEELHLQLLEDNAEALLALGRHTEFVPEFRKLLAEHPLRENLAAQLLIALYRSGRRADALSVYSGTRERLSEELGVDPGSELQRLHQAILRDEAQMRPGMTLARRHGSGRRAMVGARVTFRDRNQ